MDYLTVKQPVKRNLITHKSTIRLTQS